MSFKNDVKYNINDEFTQNDLLAITPENICCWMNKKAYGLPFPGPEDRPIHARSSTLIFAKKAISSFMPRSDVQWDNIRKEGNPTRSSDVNKLIYLVKRLEVRHEGSESNARRPIEYQEFLELLTLNGNETGGKSVTLMVGSVLTLQWHLIARIDDMMKLKFENISINVQHPHTLLCQMRWSKNISDERDAPEQIIVGSMDPRVCPLLNLAIYLESCSGFYDDFLEVQNPAIESSGVGFKIYLKVKDLLS